MKKYYRIELTDREQTIKKNDSILVTDKYGIPIIWYSWYGCSDVQLYEIESDEIVEDRTEVHEIDDIEFFKEIDQSYSEETTIVAPIVRVKKVTKIKILKYLNDSDAINLLKKL